MCAKVYHFCQRCKQMISPTINDDRLKEYDQVADYNKYVDSVQAKRIVSTRCPKCGAPWKPKLLYIGNHSIGKAGRVSRILRELQHTDRNGYRSNGRTGRYGAHGNYKKLQQAKSTSNNTTPCFHERMKRLSSPRK